ncbi:MAG TPA: Uma2 family endonuclease [Bryobacteraceae bacterium]|jgi:Uma2 family endonuclease|nr:Uma2 family endonuclease [Bryobacteraceae bacterium]
MAALPNLPLVPLDDYLAASYPDGDREYLDGIVMERNVGTPGHSTLQKILIVHFSAFERSLRIAVRPECRTRVAETRYRVPDVLIMERPFRQTDRVVLDTPLLIVEIVSPDDKHGETLRRFREYERLGVRYIVQMDPDDRTTYLFIQDNLVRRDDLASIETRGGTLPFPASELLAHLDEESGDITGE